MTQENGSGLYQQGFSGQDMTGSLGEAGNLSKLPQKKEIQHRGFIQEQDLERILEISQATRDESGAALAQHTLDD